MPEVELARGSSPYVDWAAELAGLNDADRSEPFERLRRQGIDPDEVEDLWSPIFVRTKDEMEPDPFFERAAVAEDIRFDPFEVDYAELSPGPRRIETLLFRRWNRTSDIDGLFDVLFEGPPVAAESIRDTRREVPRAAGHSPAVVGIIDDGIGFLNARFQDSPASTRIQAIWSQTLAPQPGLSQVRTKAEIDADLASLGQASEDEIYAHFTRSLYHAQVRHRLRAHATHGTFMLDLAAGADPNDAGDPMRGLPILAVQLPPQTFDDTSGYLLQPYVVTGLRWLIYWTLAANLSQWLVVNVSLGVPAGPKDGSSWLEQQIAREIERAVNLGLDIHVALPYGNAHDDRLLARMDLQSGEAEDVTLRLQPDDITPSYVECRLVGPSLGADPQILEVALTDPFGTLWSGTIPPGHRMKITAPDGQLAAAVYHHVPTGAETPHLHIAFMPTQPLFPGEPVCQPGAWKIAMKNTGHDPVQLALMVQRDGPPFPSRIGGRQAYFDEVAAYEFNPHHLDYTKLGGLVTHDGTNSAYSTVPSDRAHAVGAALIRVSDIRPEDYSADGSDWSGNAPDGSAIAGTGFALRGLLAAGLASSATVRLSGTSAAAATWTRDMAMPGTLSSQPAPAPPDRLGGRVVLDTPARRA